jgi:hypothetical protein
MAKVHDNDKDFSKKVTEIIFRELNEWNLDKSEELLIKKELSKSIANKLKKYLFSNK